MTQPSSIETIGLDTVTQKSMIDTINLLIDKGYCKYNLDNTQGLKIIAANKSTRIISRGYNNSICEVPWEIDHIAMGWLGIRQQVKS